MPINRTLVKGELSCVLVEMSGTPTLDIEKVVRHFKLSRIKTA